MIELKFLHILYILIEQEQLNTTIIIENDG